MIYISDDFCGEFILNSPFLALEMLRYRSVLPAQNGRLSEFAYFSSDPLPLRTSRCGTKLESTSLSTDVPLESGVKT